MTKKLLNKGKINQVVILEEIIICNVQLLITQSLLGSRNSNKWVEKCARNA